MAQSTCRGNPLRRFARLLVQVEALSAFCGGLLARVESECRMEFILNLVWATLAVLCAGLWMRHARRGGVSPRIQAVALLVLLVILFPVISVTDDLQTLQNPAELDCCARRHHASSCQHSISSAVATLPPPEIAELPFGLMQIALADGLRARAVEIPALASIQNRPPPVA